MAITQTVTKYQIVDIATAWNRLDNFGYHGWQKLFDYMEEMSEETGEDIELDIVAWCCDYSMYESIQDFRDAFQMDLPDDEEWNEMDDEGKLETIKEFLQDNTSLVCCEEDCIIFQAF